MTTTADRTDHADAGAPPAATIVGGVPRRNPDFTGRHDVLDESQQRLRVGTTAVLPETVHGPGGVGKSALVVEYVYKHERDFDLIWWIPAERAAQIQSALGDLTARLDREMPTTAGAGRPGGMAGRAAPVELVSRTAADARPIPLAARDRHGKDDKRDSEDTSL
jgi:hypothetical protein